MGNIMTPCQRSIPCYPLPETNSKLAQENLVAFFLMKCPFGICLFSKGELSTVDGSEIRRSPVEVGSLRVLAPSQVVVSRISEPTVCEFQGGSS